MRNKQINKQPIGMAQNDPIPGLDTGQSNRTLKIKPS